LSTKTYVIIAVVEIMLFLSLRALLRIERRLLFWSWEESFEVQRYFRIILRTEVFVRVGVESLSCV
jgi:hypothetical protein